MSSNSNMRPVLQAGTVVAAALWATALATQSWHVKHFYLGFGSNVAKLSMNLVTYSWHCDSAPPSGDGKWASFVRLFCDKPWMEDAMLTELAAKMCAVEEQSMGFFKVGCEKVQIVAYTSMACMILISLSLLFTICGATFLTMDPGAKPVLALYMIAPIIQFGCLATYIAVTYNLDDFYNIDSVTDGIGDIAGGVAGALFGAQAGAVVNGAVDVAGKVAVNDLDGMITFRYSAFIALGALVCNVVLAWCVWLYVDDLREREDWAVKGDFGPGNGTFDQQGQWDQQQQQQQQWGGAQQQPEQQWAGAQPQQQQWGGAAAGAPNQWSQTTTTWAPGQPTQQWQQWG